LCEYLYGHLPIFTANFCQTRISEKFGGELVNEKGLMQQ
jgi:hypothetical protein